MWWHKLIKNWTILDYAVFVAFCWLLMFGFSTLVVLIRVRPFDLAFTAAYSFVMVPVSFVVTYALQSYSSNPEEIDGYPALLVSDFEGDRLLKKDRILAFFYAAWCPFCRMAFPLLKLLSPDSSYEVFRVDLSDEGNPLWESFDIDTVPTLVAFDGGREFWRANGIPMLGLRKSDFEKADAAMKAPKPL